MSNITETQYETNIPLDLIDRNDKCKNCRFIHTGNDSDGVGEQKCMKYILKNSDNSSCNLIDVEPILGIHCTPHECPHVSKTSN